MTPRRVALAGRHDPDSPPGEHEAGPVADALRRDGQSDSTVDGPLALGWAGGPPPGKDASVLCLLDGRITNAAALVRELDMPPEAAIEEILAAGFARWGADLPGRLRGEFALVAWDRAARRGLLACDPLGHRALFLHRVGRRTLFASEARNLIALLPRRPAPDEVAIALWLGRSGLRDGRTLYEGIHRLEGGRLVELSEDGARLRRYWEPPRPARDGMTRAECTQAVSEAMEAAVGRAVAGEEVSTGIMLSGGFDSGAIAALAPGARPYSMAFRDHPTVDETARVNALLSHIGAEGVVERFHGGSALAAALDFQAEWELPSVAPGWFVWVPLLQRAAGDGISIMLDGEGGDEVFGCSPYLLADLLRAGRLPAALQLARRLPGLGDPPPTRIQRRALIRYGVRGALPARLHEALRRWRGRGAPAWLTDDALSRWREHDPLWGWKRRRGPRWWAALADVLTDGPVARGAPDQLRREGRLTGIEFRHPFRDAQLFERMLTLPPEAAFDPHLDRPLAREAMRDLLPDAVRLNTAKPHFNAVVEQALTGPDRAMVEQLLAQPTPELRKHVNLDAVRTELLSRRPQSVGHPGWALDLWQVATLECWLRHQDEPAWSARKVLA
jgi:asparagine synthase (glutamine-hydrolysing)